MRMLPFQQPSPMQPTNTEPPAGNHGCRFTKSLLIFNRHRRRPRSGPRDIPGKPSLSVEIFALLAFVVVLLAFGILLYERLHS